ncbi:hypothetical protein CSC81_18605, partial [Tenacibaculum discolor]
LGRGDKKYQLLRRIKKGFEPKKTFKKRKKKGGFSIDQKLRYENERNETERKKFQNFSENGGIFKIDEKMNSSGSSRKSPERGGKHWPK